jgi:hypothetical protein
MKMWGGNFSTNGPSLTTASTTNNSSLIDTNRPEPDETWDDAWIALNPGTASVVWVRVAQNGGWIGSTGTFTLATQLGAPFATGVPSGTPYEVFQTFSPDQWLAAANWAISQAYPWRHRHVFFEAMEDINQQIIDWAHLARSSAVANPTLAPTVTASNAYQGPPGPPTSPTAFGFQTGNYSFGYTYLNTNGETLISPLATVALTQNQSIDIAALPVPDGVLKVNFYGTLIPGGTALAQFTLGSGKWNPSVLPSGTGLRRGEPDGTGTIPEIFFIGPPGNDSKMPPTVNTTSIDIVDLIQLQRKYNPGQYPEIVQDLGGHMWKPLGGTTIQIWYIPIGQFSWRFVCTAPPLAIQNETDTTGEPYEMILTGAEWFLWDLLQKTAAGQNQTAWEKLSKDAFLRYHHVMHTYAMDGASRVTRRPYITPVW